MTTSEGSSTVGCSDKLLVFDLVLLCVALKKPNKRLFLSGKVLKKTVDFAKLIMTHEEKRPPSRSKGSEESTEEVDRDSEPPARGGVDELTGQPATEGPRSSWPEASLEVAS